MYVHLGQERERRRKSNERREVFARDGGREGDGKSYLAKMGVGEENREKKIAVA